MEIKKQLTKSGKHCAKTLTAKLKKVMLDLFEKMCNDNNKLKSMQP